MASLPASAPGRPGEAVPGGGGCRRRLPARPRPLPSPGPAVRAAAARPFPPLPSLRLRTPGRSGVAPAWFPRRLGYRLGRAPAGKFAGSESRCVPRFSVIGLEQA